MIACTVTTQPEPISIPSRVVMLSLLYPPLYSGAGAQAAQLSEMLVDRGVYTVVLTAGRPGPGALASGRIPVRRFPLYGSARTRALAFAFLSSIHLARQRRKFDVLHIHGAFWYAFLPALVARSLNKRIVVKLTRLGDDDPAALQAGCTQHPLNSLALRLFELADIVVAQTAAQAYSVDLYDMRLRSKVRVIPNAVDTEIFSPCSVQTRASLRRKLDLPLEGPVILHVAGLLPHKGADALIQAVSPIAKELPNLRLLLVGPTTEDSSSSNEFERSYVLRVRALIETGSLGAQVRLVGNVERQVLREYYQVADLFVLPSTREGMPNALLEAAASGVAVVAYKIPGCAEMLASHNDLQAGLLLPPNDVSALSSAIRQLISMPELRTQMAARGRELVCSRYSPETVVCRYIDIYQTLMGASIC